jgi:hypothetical protein
MIKIKTRLNQRIKELAIMSTLIVMVGVMMGCSSSSNGLIEIPANVGFSGNASILGTVSVSKSDANSVSSGSALTPSIGASSIQPLLNLNLSSVALRGLAVNEFTTMSGGIAKLYNIKEDGTTEDTGLSTAVTGSGEYEFKNIKDGKMYIIETIKKGKSNGAGKVPVLRQKVFVQVLQGTTTPITAHISPKTGYIVESIITTIIKKSGTSIDPALLKIVIDSIDEVITDQISKGAINLQMVQLMNEGDVDKLTYTGASDEELRKVEEFTSDDTVSDTLIEADVAAQLNSKVTDTEKDRNLMRRVFGAAQGSSDSSSGNTQQDHIPDFYINGFAKSFRSGKTITLHQFINGYRIALSSVEKVKPENSSAALFTSWSSKIKINLEKLYAFYDSGQSSKVARAKLKVDLKGTSLEKRIPVIKVVFPKAASERLNLNDLSAQVFTIPQAVMIFGMVGLFDDDQDNSGSGSNQEPKMDHFKFIEALGSMSFKEGSIQIIEARVRPVPLYVEESGQEKNALSAEVSLYIPEGKTTLFKVVLNYINTNGNVATPVEFTPSSYSNGGNPESRFRIEPWKHDQNPTPIIVSDYRSGEVTIEVIDKTSGAVLASKKAIIYKVNMSRINLLNNPENYDTDDSGKAYPSFTWTTPKLDPGHAIPANHSLAYAIDIGAEVKLKESLTETEKKAAIAAVFPTINNREIHGSGNYRHVNLYNSWKNHRFVKSTSFISPIALSKINVDPNKIESISYSINVRPVIIKNTTQEVIWEGKSAHHRFIVGSIVNWTMAISGKISFSNKFVTALQNGHMHRLKNSPNGEWKIGLFRQGYWDEVNQKWKDEFWDSSNKSARVPVINSDDKKLVASLGNLSIATSTSNINIVNFPSISKSDIQKYAEYQFIIWYDQTGTGTDSKGNSVPLTTDAIDVSQVGGSEWVDVIEEMDHGSRVNLRRDDFRLRLESNYNDPITGEHKYESKEIRDKVELDIVAY